MCKKVKFPKLCELKKLEEKEDEEKKIEGSEKNLFHVSEKS